MDKTATGLRFLSTSRIFHTIRDLFWEACLSYLAQMPVKDTSNIWVINLQLWAEKSFRNTVYYRFSMLAKCVLLKHMRHDPTYWKAWWDIRDCFSECTLKYTIKVVRNLWSKVKDDAVGICVGMWPKGKNSVWGLSKGYHWLVYR